MRFVRVPVVLLYSSIDTAIVWKKSSFISSEGTDFHLIDNLSIVVHTQIGDIKVFMFIIWGMSFRFLLKSIRYFSYSYRILIAYITIGKSGPVIRSCNCLYLISALSQANLC